MRGLLWLAAFGLGACATGASPGPDASGSGQGGDTGDAGELVIVIPDASQPGGDGGWVDPCPESAKLVYVVEDDRTFSSFDPRQITAGQDPFRDLGKLSCPAGNATPFSMSVDRSATAWVLYSDGHIFRVDIATLGCQATSYVPDATLKLFGMGFVSNSAGSQDETLFIAGGPKPGSGPTSEMATLQVPALVLSKLGTITGSPELTGTGDAKLWGFFPDLTPPKVAQIDKGDGSDLVTYPAAALQGNPQAWAFAFWGGDFWIFLKHYNEPSTKVHRMHSKDGTLDTPLPDTGRRIVGAGVSTCAPVTIN